MPLPLNVMSSPAALKARTTNSRTLEIANNIWHPVSTILQCVDAILRAAGSQSGLPVLLSGGKHVVVGFVLLEHEPHALQ